MTEEEMTVAGVRVAFGSDGLIPVIAQDENNGEVLMLAYANSEAVRLTVESGRAHYFSRSRSELWRKGDSSGNTQSVSQVAVDCDGDALIYFVQQEGGACHTGERSCFYRKQNAAGGSAASEDGDHELVLGQGLALLERVVVQRLRDLPEGSYVARLHERGLGYMAQKVVEEAGETVVAALERRDDQLVEESADLLFHLAVLLAERSQSLATVAALLEARHRERGGDSSPLA